MINWREIPFARLLMPVVIGILSAIHLDYFIPFLDILLLLSVVVFAVLHYQTIDRSYRFLSGLTFNLFLFLLAYQLTYYQYDHHHSQYLAQYQSETSNVLIGSIQKMPDKSQNKWVKIELDVHQIGSHKDSLNNSKGTILAYIEKDENSLQLSYGNILMLQTRLSAIEAPKNPQAFDYQAYLKLQNINFQSFTKPDKWIVLAQQEGNPILQFAFGVREKLIATLKKHLPSTNEFAVGSALILGYKDDLPDELRAAYAGTGAMHVLAVSGLHVGLVYGIMALLLRVFRFRHRAWNPIKVGLLITVIWSFAILTGASASVMRAATMFTFLAVGREMQRYINIYNTLAASAFCLLLYDPFLLKNVGFQLSYLAVGGIIYFQPKIYRLIIIDHKIADYLWALVAVSVAATISTLPISLFYFHQFPVYFWLSGLVVVPAAGLILSGGILLFWLEWLVPSISVWIGSLLYGMIWAVNSLIFLIQQLPSGLVTGIWIGMFGAIILYLILGTAIMAINTKNMKWLLAAFALLTILSVQQLMTKVQQFYKKEIVIYHSYKNTIIDCLDGTNVYSLRSDSISAKNLQFTTQNYRWSRGIREVHDYSLSEAAPTFSTWIYQQNHLGFYDKKIGILDKNIKIASPTKMKVNYLLLRDNPSIDIETITENYDFDRLIFDASNSTWRIEKWKKKCQELDIDYYDISTEGALTIEITH